MGDLTYQRTTGYKNWINKRAWMPRVTSGVATQVDGRQYTIHDNGWRRVRSPDQIAKEVMEERK